MERSYQIQDACSVVYPSKDLMRHSPLRGISPRAEEHHLQLLVTRLATQVFSGQSMDLVKKSESLWAFRTIVRKVLVTNQITLSNKHTRI